ncbi:MAG TPA: serine/threonine-protein kinase, partial [Chroococcales cyanobacterium]
MNSIDNQDQVENGTGNGGTADRLGGKASPVTGSAGDITPMGREFQSGEIVADRYKVLSVIGRGGFGSVYKVYQLLLKKEFALKTLNPSNMSQTTILRLSKEAQAAGRLAHPNLVRAVDFGMLDGVQPYMVMEYVEGPTLAQYLKQAGRLELKEALEIFIPLVDALGYAHKEGVIHRDLKPSNIILSHADLVGSKLVPKIVDFGIAKIQFGEDAHVTLTGTGDIFGTPLYMSPEQCAGTGVDSRSDVYAMGCLLFETLTGAPPFRGVTPLETMMQHGVLPVPSLKEASLGLEFPPALEKVLAKLLAKDPNLRYQTCEQVTADLTALQRGEFDKISSLPSSSAGASFGAKKTNAFLYPAVALLLGIVIGAAVGSTLSGFQKLPQFKEPVEAAIPARPLESRGFLDLDPSDEESDFFLRQSRDKIVFHRPPGRVKQFGNFAWWQNGKLETASAVDGATIPKSAKLIFEAQSAMLEYPYYWGYFRPTELYGVLLQPHSCYLDYQINVALGQMPLQENLRLLTMADKVMSKRAFNGI